MNLKTIAMTATLALAGWIAIAWAKPLVGPTGSTVRGLAGYQLAEDEDHHEKRGDKNRPWDWDQGERGHWNRDKDDNQWRWQGAGGDDWYQGQRGHWYREPNGWQFGTAGIICNNQGRNCRRGGYLPPNGEGMVSRENPRWFWHCDSEGHHCKWATRPR